MIPESALATGSLPPASYLQPLVPPSSTVAYDLGPVALNDPTGGLDAKLWTASVVGDDILIEAEDHAPSVLITAAGTTHISLTFDQNGAPFLAFIQGGVAKFWWYDTLANAYAITELPAGSVTPFASLDERRRPNLANGDIILAYILDGDLVYRQQRDRYTVEYLLRENVDGVLTKIGMTDALRFGFNVVPGVVVTGVTFLNAAPDGDVGTYSHQYQVTGGLPPYTFSVASGALPAGTTLSASGLLSGTITTAGSYSFTVQVVDSIGDGTQLPETVQVSVLALTGNAPAGITGSAYSYSYTATGGVTPYAYSISTGALPPGITLNSSTGAITGTPTAAGSYSWRVLVTDALGAVAFVDDAAAISGVLSITNPAPNIVADLAYSHTYVAAGGAGGNTWLLGGTLPTGITFDAGTATLSGTTTALGTYTFTVQVTDANSTVATLNESVTVSADVPFIITLANGDVIQTTGATIQFRDRPGESIKLEDID